MAKWLLNSDFANPLEKYDGLPNSWTSQLNELILIPFECSLCEAMIHGKMESQF